MKFIIKNIIPLLTVVLSCSHNPNIQVNVIEQDFVNKTIDVVQGELIQSDIAGSKGLIVFDSLIMVVTNNPNGQIQVFSNNSHKLISSLCQRGRARNEALSLSSFTEQAFKEKEHIILLAMNIPDELMKIDMTASLNTGNTIIVGSDSFMQLGDGEYVLLDNDYEHRFEYKRNKYGINEIKGVPSTYTLVENGKRKELKIFKTSMKVDTDKHKLHPYLGSINKHPNRNLVIQDFMYMDYLLFMDFDSDNYFAVHQLGAPSFNDIYTEEAFPPHFTDMATSSEYVMLLYWQGNYGKKMPDETRCPEVLIFDWKGNYITGFKMDRKMWFIEYDEIHKTLYGLTNNEELYAYKLSEILP